MIWLENCPQECKPVYYRRYIDDIFLLFTSPDHSVKFQEYLNKQHINLKFTSEVEQNDEFTFLDINITRNNNNFITTIFRKSTFSGIYTNFQLAVVLRGFWKTFTKLKKLFILYLKKIW